MCYTLPVVVLRSHVNAKPHTSQCVQHGAQNLFSIESHGLLLICVVIERVQIETNPDAGGIPKTMERSLEIQRLLRC